MKKKAKKKDIKAKAAERADSFMPKDMANLSPTNPPAIMHKIGKT